MVIDTAQRLRHVRVRLTHRFQQRAEQARSTRGRGPCSCPAAAACRTLNVEDVDDREQHDALQQPLRTTGLAGGKAFVNVAGDISSARVVGSSTCCRWCRDDVLVAEDHAERCCPWCTAPQFAIDEVGDAPEEQADRRRRTRRRRPRRSRSILSVFAFSRAAWCFGLQNPLVAKARVLAAFAIGRLRDSVLFAASLSIVLFVDVRLSREPPRRERHADQVRRGSSCRLARSAGSRPASATACRSCRRVRSPRRPPRITPSVAQNKKSSACGTLRAPACLASTISRAGSATPSSATPAPGRRCKPAHTSAD